MSRREKRNHPIHETSQKENERNGHSKRPGRAGDFETLEGRVLLSVARAIEPLQVEIDQFRAVYAVAQNQPAASPVTTVIAIDAALAAQGLIPSHVAPGTTVVLLRAGADPMAQITQALAPLQDVTSLQILTHGSSGELALGTDGSQIVNRHTLTLDAAELGRWSKSLAANATIALYGCDVASGKVGRAFVRALARRTGVMTAASTDATGAAAAGGNWKLEYVAGRPQAIPAPPDVPDFQGLLGTETVTVSAGSTLHVVGLGATAVDPQLSLSSTIGGLMLSSASVQITGGYRSGEDVLALPVTTGFQSTFTAGTGTLNITSTAAQTLAQYQAVLRTVTYQNLQSPFAHLDARQVTFAAGTGTSAPKALSLDLPVDAGARQRILDALNVVGAIGQKIQAITGQPYSGNTTAVPYTGSDINDLLYPTNLATTVQPQQIGAYLQLEPTAATYFTFAGTITDLSGLQSALAAKLHSIVPGTSPLLTVQTAFTKPADSDARSITLNVTIANSKGPAQVLQLDPLVRDLGLTLPDGPTVQVGGGADIRFSISLDLQGRQYGSNAAGLAANKTTLAFGRLNALAGLAFGGLNTTADIGAIGGQLVNAGGVLGAVLPVTLNGGSSRTLDLWAADGSDVGGFSSTPTGRADITLPISASINGVSATTANTRVVVSDPGLLNGDAFAYATTDFDQLKYFATIGVDDIIQDILKIRNVYASLTNSDSSLFGVQLPFLKNVTLGQLADFGTLFDSAIGSQVDVTQPVLNTNGRDQLTGANLPVPGGSSTIYSDLQGSFQFGVVVNNASTVTRVTVAANSSRQTLSDLVTDINAALVTAGLNLTTADVSDKLTFSATNIAVQSFSLVPVQPTGSEAGELSPGTPPTDLSTLALNTPLYYTVTGTTSGTVTGTTYYTIDTPLGAAAVHAGILAAGQTGVVEVVRAGATGALAGSTLNGVTSASANSSADAYLVTYVGDLSRMGIGAPGTAPTLLQTVANGVIQGSIPLPAVLSGPAALLIGANGTNYTINVASNANSSVAQTLSDVQSALAAAGISAADLSARLVDSTGTALSGAPAAGTPYYLSFYLPAGSSWSNFTVSPTGAASSYLALPLGFFSGDQSSAQRPANLRTFQDFQNRTLFPKLSITPVYDNVNNTVTLEFAASSSTTRSQTPAFTFSMSPLGQLQISTASAGVRFAPSLTTNIAFGVQFQIGPAGPVQLIGNADLPANGQLSADSTFTLNFALGDTYTVTVPHGWTAANADRQDLLASINRGLAGAVNSASSTVDLTSQLIAQLGGDGNDLVLTNATPVGGATTLTHTHGVLSQNLAIPFTYQGQHYVLSLPASQTTGDTTFGQLVAKLNSALSNVTVDANNNGVADAGESTVSFAQELFFTTIAGANGAHNSDVHLFTTSAVGATWPTSITLSAARTDPAATALGFNDGASGSQSSISAQASGVNSVLAENGSQPLASATAQLTLPSFSGSVPYGLNTLDFSTAAGSLSAKVGVALNTVGLAANTVGSYLDQYLTRTLTAADGTGQANASLTFSGISAESGATIDPSATIGVSIPDISATSAIAYQALGVPIPIPGESAGRLDADATVNFLNGGTLYSVTLTASQAASNASFAALVAQFNAALAHASSTTAGVIAAVNAAGLFTFTAGADDSLQVTVQTTIANPGFAHVAFLPSLAAFGEVGLQGAFGGATVASALNSVLPVLDGVQGNLPVLSNFNLPLINASVSSLIDIKGSLLRQISTFSNMTVSSVSAIAPALAAALNIPSNQVQVTFDAVNNAYRIDLQYQTAVATTRPLNITLADFYAFSGATMPAGLSRLVDTGSNAPLTVKIGATVTLALGIDLTDPANPRAFLYGYDGSGSYGLTDGTSIQLQIQAAATGINFTAATGALGVFVRGGDATLGGAVQTGGDGNPVYTFSTDPNELHFVPGSNAAVLGVGLQGSAGTSATDASATKFYLAPGANDADATAVANYQSSFTGSVQANLPLYTPTEFTNPFNNRSEQVNVLDNGSVQSETVAPGGNVFDLEIADIGAYAADSLAYTGLQQRVNQIYTVANGHVSGGQQSQIDQLNAQMATLAGNGDVSIYTPDVSNADSGIQAPTLIDVLRDPSLLVDGIDTLLGGVQTALQGLDSLNIPIIGPVLGDAVKNVFSWRSGWLRDLNAQLRNRGEEVFSSLQDEIYNFLGPSGANLLLQNNGASGVNSIVVAQSPDDVGLQFLDGSGNPISGGNTFGADAVQFQVHLGSLLVNTGANLGFNFDSLAPAFTLGINGGLTFKLGWDATLGFGYSLKDGFYITTNSTPGVSQIELQFAAGLSGADTTYTVVDTGQTVNGIEAFGIKDSSGDWVQGPADGNGNRSNLNVIEVDGTGTPVPANQVQAPNPADCDTDGTSGSGSGSSASQTYWVVAMADGGGNLVPAYVDKLGAYRAQSGSDWTTFNGGDGAFNPDQMVLFNKTAPFTAFGSLFFFNLTAVDQMQLGLHPHTDADYYFTTDDAVSSYGRNDPSTGVNRNNSLPTLLSGTIAVKFIDPSAASGSYVARPGISPTGFVLMDGSSTLGGQPVTDDSGQDIPVEEFGGQWYVVKLKDGVSVGHGPSDFDPDYLITDDQSANRITYQELHDAGTAIFQLALTAQAVVNLDLTLSVGSNAAIPKLTASLNIDWKYEKTFGGPQSPDTPPPSEDDKTAEKLALLPEVGLNNIRLDLGSFLSQFIKPIADKVNDAMQPIDPLLADLQTPIPVLSDIAGHDIKLTTLLATFGGARGEAIATLIDIATEVGQLSALIAALPSNANAYLPIGNFWLAKVGAGPLGQPGMGTQIYYDNSEITAPSIAQRNQSLIANPGAGLNAVTNALGGLDALDANNPGNSEPGVSGSDRGGFQLPILQNPLTIFKILMGQDEPLVTFSLPKLNFSFDTDIPLLRIICFEVGLHFNFQVQGQLDIGYDTYGLREFFNDGNPADVLDGFYISTRANADGTGAAVNAFSLHCSIGLYGGVNVVLAKAGIEGGFEFNASVAWNDPNNDGKLRLPEMIQLVENHNNPLDLADLSFSGDVYARYYYWVGVDVGFFKITLFEGGSTFAEIPLFNLTRDGQDGPPVFASKITTQDSNGTTYPNTLQINMGPDAPQRVSNEDPLNAADGAEQMRIWNDSPGSSTIHVEYLNYSNSHVETYSGISRVVAYGGEGNDLIDASGLNGIPVDFEGGAGDDTILLGSGSDTVSSTIDGGSGNDRVVVSGGGKVTINVDGSNDTITGGSASDAADTFVISGGNNTITGGGGAGSNVFQFTRAFGTNALNLDASAAQNILDFNNASQAITATLGGAGSVIAAGSTNTATFNLNAVTKIRGTQGDDTFNATNPQTRAANSGQGLILQGGPGNDAYNITANDLSGVAANGITIDDGEYPTALATLGTPTLCDTDGDIMSIPVSSGGSGYVQPPDVVITDPTGSGARAVASIDDNGVITGIYILNGGQGYTHPTVLLVEPTDIGNKLTISSDTTGAVSVDERGNSNSSYELSATTGGPIKWVSYTNPGVTRPAGYAVDEIDGVDLELPAGAVTLNDHLDLEGDLTINAGRFLQNAAITANDVSITTQRGFAANYPIDTIENGDILLHVTGKGLANYVASIATATATVVGGVVTGFTITNPGSGYDFPPTITIDDPNGFGARAIAEIAGGQVTGIVLLDGGHGYLTTPAPVVAIAPSASLQINDDLSTSTVGSGPGTGDGRGTITLRAELGAIDQTGDVLFPTGANIGWAGGDFVYNSTSALTDITAGRYTGVSVGQGAIGQAVIDGDGRVVAINVLNGGSGYSKDLLPSVQIDGGATATAIVNNAGQVTGFHITYPGQGYAIAPAVNIVANGFGRIVGADAGATALNRNHLKSAGGSLVAIAYYGIGDENKPLKTDVAHMVAETFGLAAGIHMLQNSDLTIGKQQNLNGISTVNGDVSIAQFGGKLGLGSPVQETNADGQLLWQDAAKTIPIYATDSAGNIIYQGGQISTGAAQIKLVADGIDVNNYLSAQGGQLVLEPTRADAAIGLPGTGASADAVIAGGQVSGFANLDGGVAYSGAPLVILTPPGQRAFATAAISAGQVSSIALTFGGSNYNAGAQPIVTLTGGGANGAAPAHPATAVATYDGSGKVTGFTITNPGSGYLTAPAVDISLPGTQATARAVVVGGTVTGLQIINPGSNYSVAPGVTIDPPFPFVFNAKEINYFEQGFGGIVVGRADGRHPFYAPDATFNDALTLRSPLGGEMHANQVIVQSAPLVVIGSVQGMELTPGSPTLSGTDVAVNNNIIVDDATNGFITATTGQVSIAGSALGKIDAAAGATTANLTISAVGDILVGGAIGSSAPLNNLTLTSSSPGNITLQGNVTLMGNLHITRGNNVTIGGNVSIGGDLIIDQGASVSFNGTVSVHGNLLISTASSVSFSQNVAVTGNFTVGNAADPSQLDTLTLGANARLDVSGAVGVYSTSDISFGNRIGQTLAPSSITLRSDSGDINFQGAVNSGGVLTIQKADNVTFGQNLSAPDLEITLATGQTRFQRAVTLGQMNVTSEQLVQVSNLLTLTTGSGTITSDTVDFGGGSGSIRYSGAGSSAFTVKPYTVSRDFTIGSPPGVFTSLDISDVDLAAIGAGFSRVNFGDSIAGTGNVTIGSIGSQEGAGNSQLFNSTSIFGGAINVVQDVDSAATSGDLTLIALTGDITINGAINTIVSERSAMVQLQSILGKITINQPVYAASLLRLVAAGAVSSGSSGYVNGPSLRLSAGGAVNLPSAGNNLSSVAIDAGNNPVALRNDHNFSIATVDGVSGINSGTANTSLTTNGATVTQVQPITASGLVLLGTGGNFVLTLAGNDIATLAANTGAVSYVDANMLSVGTVNGTAGISTTGAATLVTGAALMLSQPIVATSGGAVSLATHAGDITTGSTGGITADGLVSLTAANGISTAAAITSTQAGVTLAAQAGSIAETTASSITAHGAVSLTGPVDIAGGGPITTTGAVSLHAGRDLAWTSAGAINAGGNVALFATRALSNGATIVATGGAVSLYAQGTTLSTLAGANVTASGTVTYTAGQSITDAGTIAASAAVTFSAGMDIAVSSAANVGGASVTFTATNGIALASALTSTAGNIGLTAQNASISATDVAGLGAQGNVGLTAALDITGGGPVGATGTVTFQAGRNIAWDSAGAITAGGAVSLTAATALTNGAIINSTHGPVALTAQGTTLITQAGANVIAGGAVTYTAHLAITDGGGIASSAAVALGAGTDITVNGSANISGASVTFTAGNGISVASAIASTAGNVLLTATAASIAATDAAGISAAGNITLTAPHDITGGGPIGASGAATFIAGGNIAWDAAGIVNVTGALTLTAANAITDSAGMTSGAAVAFSAGSGITVNAGANLSGASVTFTAGSGISLASALTSTAGDVSLTAQTASVSQTDAAGISAAGNVTIASAQDITGGGPIGATGAVAFQAGHNVTWDAAGTISAAGNVSITAGNAIDNAAAISSTGGSVSLAAQVATIVTHSTATVSALGLVRYTAPASITDAGAIASSSAVTLTAGTDIAVSAGANVGGASVTFSAGNGMSVASALNSTAGNVTLTAHAAAIALTDAAAINAHGNVLLTAPQNISGGGAIGASGTLSLNSGGAISWDAAGAISAGGAVQFAANLGITDAATIASSSTLTLTAGANLAIAAHADIRGTTVALSAANGLSLAAGITSTVGDVTLTAHGDAIAETDAVQIGAAGNITLSAPLDISGGGPLTAAGAVTIGAGRQLTWDAAGSISAGGAVVLSAGTTIDDSASIHSSAAVGLSSGADIEIAAGAPISGAGITFTAAAGIGIASSLTSTAGDVSLVAQGDSIEATDAAGISAAGNVSLNASRDITGGGAIGATGAAAIGAGNNVTWDVAGTISAAGNVSITAGNAMDNAAAITSTGGAITLLAQAATIVTHSSATVSALGAVHYTSAASISDAGAITSSAAVIFGAATDITVNTGAPVVGASVTLTATNGMSLAANVSSMAGDVLLTAQTASISQADTAGISAAGNVTLNSAQDITGGGPISASGTVSWQAGHNVTWDAAGAISAAGNVSITAGNAVDDAATISSTAGSVSLVAQAASILTHPGANVSAHGSVHLTAAQGITDAGTITSLADISLGSGGAIAISAGANLRGASVSLTAANGISIGSAMASTAGDINSATTGGSILTSDAAPISAVGNVVFTSARDITGGGAITATGATTFNAAGNITWDTAGTIESTGALSLSAGGAIADSAPMTSTMAVTFGAATDIMISSSANLRGASVALTAGNGISIASDLISTTGDVLLTSHAASIAATDLAGITSAGNVALNSAADITGGGPISAAGIVTFQAGHNIAWDAAGMIGAGGNVSLTAGGSIDNAAAISSTGGSVALFAQVSSIVTRSGAQVTAHGFVHYSAAQGIVDNAAIASSADVTFSAGTDITVGTGANVSAASITLTAGNGMAIGSTLTSTAGNVLLTAQAATIVATDAATISAAGNVMLTASQDITGGGAIGATGTVGLAAGRNIAWDAAGIVNASGNITMTAVNGLSNASAISSAHGAVALTAYNGALVTAGTATVHAPGAVSFNAGQGITDAGAITSGAAITLAGGTDLSVAGSANLSGTTVTLSAGNGIAIASAITSTAGSTSLTAHGASIVETDTAVITAAGNVAFAAAQAITGGGAITATGTATLHAGGNLAWDSAAAINAGGALELTAGGAIGDFAPMTSAAAVGFSAGTDITVNSNANVSGASVTFAAGNGMSVASDLMSTEGDVSLTAHAASIAMSDAAGIAAAGNVLLAGNLDIAGGGPVSATGNITFMAGRNLSWDVTGTLAASGNILLTSGNALTDAATLTSSGGTVSLDAEAGTLTSAVGAAITAPGVIQYTAGQSISDSGTTSSATRIVFTAGADILVGSAAAVNAPEVTFTAGHTIDSSSPITAATGNLSLTTQTGSLVTHAAAPLSAHGNLVLNIHQDITTGDTLTAGSLLTMSSVAGGIELDSPLSAGGTVAVTAGKGIADNATITSTGGAVSLAAQGGTLTVAPGATIVAPGNVSMSSSQWISLSGNITSNGALYYTSPVILSADVTMSATSPAGNITFAAGVDGAHSLSIAAGGDLQFSGTVGGSTPLGALIIQTAKTVTAAGGISAGHVIQTGVSGAATYHGIITIDSQGVAIASGQLTAAGAIHSAGPVTLAADQLFLQATADVVSAGAVTLTGTSQFTLQNGGSVTAGNGQMLLITSDNPSLGSAANSVHGTGLLVIQPASDSTRIDIGSAGPAFDLTDAEIGTIANGFARIIIGRGTGEGFNSGDSGNGPINVTFATFNTAVTLRSPAAEGPITVDGNLATTGNNGTLSLVAGGDVTVNGSLSVAGTGDISLKADADGDNIGQVVIADTAPTTVSAANGDIQLIGAYVKIGSDAAPATVSAAHGLLDIEALATAAPAQVGTAPGDTSPAPSQGTVIVTNANTKLIAGNNLTIGTDPSASPPIDVQVQGNLNVGGNISIRSSGDAAFDQFRGKAGGRIDVLADNNVTTDNGTLIATGGPVNLQADANNNGSGAVTQTGLQVSEPSTLDLQATLGTVRIVSVARAGDIGRAAVNLTNLTANKAAGYVTLVLYASPSQTLEAKDQVIGERRLYIKLNPGKSKVIVVPILIPTSVVPGSYYIGVEQLPYRGNAVSAGPGGSISVSDSNIAFTPGTINVQWPTLTGTVNSTFTAQTWQPGGSGRINLSLTNTSGVKSMGYANIDLYASADGTLAHAILLRHAVNQSARIGPGKTRRLSFNVKLPNNLPGGQSYRVIAVIQPLASGTNPTLPATELTSMAA